MGLKKVLNALYVRFLAYPIIKKYGGVWGLKSHLHRTEGSDKKLLSIYDRFMTKGGSWIGYNSSFKGQPCFPHGINGIFISGGAKIGKNCVIFQQVTIGSNTLSFSERWGFPEIGDNVYIGAGAKIIGAVKVGDNCRIGANAVVYKDMPSNTVAVAAPTRIIQKEGLDNRFFSQKEGKWVYFDDGEWREDK